jgi:hypothetical protein
MKLINNISMKPRYLEIEQLQSEESRQTSLSVLSWVAVATKFESTEIVVNCIELAISDMKVLCFIIL